MRPIIHWHEGKFVCYRDKDRVYVDFIFGEGQTPVDAYRDWLIKLP